MRVPGLYTSHSLAWPPRQTSARSSEQRPTDCTSHLTLLNLQVRQPDFVFGAYFLLRALDNGRTDCTGSLATMPGEFMTCRLGLNRLPAILQCETGSACLRHCLHNEAIAGYIGGGTGRQQVNNIARTEAGCRCLPSLAICRLGVHLSLLG